MSTWPSDESLGAVQRVVDIISMMLRYQLPMNTPMWLLWGASGRAILAYLDEQDIDGIYRAEGAAPASGDPLPARRTLEKDLTIICMRGYKQTRGQKIVGAVGISTPVFGIDGKLLGCICATIRKARIAAKDHLRLGQLVGVTAGQLSAAHGAPVNNRAKSDTH